MQMDRRNALKLGGAAVPAGVESARPPPRTVRRRTVPTRCGSGPGWSSSRRARSSPPRPTTASFPGPLLRFTEGRPVVVDVHNDTDTPEQLHWHGQIVPVDVDGSAEEGTPYIPAHGMRRSVVHPRACGFPLLPHPPGAGQRSVPGPVRRAGGARLHRAQATPARTTRKCSWSSKEFQPAFSSGGDMAQDFLAGSPVPELQSRGEKAMADSPGQGDAARLRGRLQRLQHQRRASSATASRSRSRPGSACCSTSSTAAPPKSAVWPCPATPSLSSRSTATRCPRQAEVPVLWIGTAERVSAVVEMDHPGVWVLGDLSDDDRNAGMGTVVEYAGRSGITAVGGPGEVRTGTTGSPPARAPPPHSPTR